MHNDMIVQRATSAETEAAYTILEEYYESASVLARDSKEAFAALYFQTGAGVWLARKEKRIIGCVALRPLDGYEPSGEIKRMYVQLPHRKEGVAQRLLDVLEAYAAQCGYHWLYLDSAPGMDAAVRLYRRNGYEECSRYNDNPQATIFLRKRLPTG